PRAQSRRRAFLADHGARRPRVADARARGVDGEGLPGVARDGKAPRSERVRRRRPLHHRRHRALRVDPRGTRMRLRPHRLPGDPGLAKAYRQPARLRADGLAPRRGGDRGVAANLSETDWSDSPRVTSPACGERIVRGTAPPYSLSLIPAALIIVPHCGIPE